jgi:hypothetical protein
MRIPCLQQVRNIRTLSIRMYSNQMQRKRQHDSQERYELRVLNTSAPIAKARSNRRATTETTALERQPRYATNAVKPATARTIAPFVHAIHVAFEVTNYQPAIRPRMHFCVAKKSQKVTTTLFAHVLSAKHASFLASWRKIAHTPIVWTSMPIG